MFFSFIIYILNKPFSHKNIIYKSKKNRYD